ncbi:MAG: hypothetical protein EAZ27_09715 [Cytophagales bacterium]|nr:MAG: hypothetical protein EAZ27_09715 [Cytophagales bacterium]
MTNILIILFSLTLVYLLAAGRLRTYSNALAMQGFLLCAIAFKELQGLKELNYLNLVFIMLETLFFKGLITPLFLNYLIKKNNIQYEREPNETNFNALLKVALIFIFSFIIGYKLHHHDFNVSIGTEDASKIIYFTSSLSAIFTGLLIVIRRVKIITHIVGYLVLENGLFLLTLALGDEMPIVVNLAILFDIISTTLLLGVFVNRVQMTFKDTEISTLTELRD